VNDTMSLLPQQTYDVHPDGSRFLMIQEGNDATSGPVIMVVQGLLEDLKARLPTK
jgi:hypothetical protein